MLKAHRHEGKKVRSGPTRPGGEGNGGGGNGGEGNRGNEEAGGNLKQQGECQTTPGLPVE
jgi:hypothetical protein